MSTSPINATITLMNREERTELFVRGMWEWFREHKRSLPWRDLDKSDLDHTAYLILVSEVMLQQTQVSRIITLYKNFIRTFPTVIDLSRASNAEVIIAWRGLGYNKRSLRLRDTARLIVERGGFPRSMEELLALPGIGHYTAGAIRNFAFDLPTPCIDVNIERILHRCFYGVEKKDGSLLCSRTMLLKLARNVLDAALHSGTTADWHAALMDFGALVCTKSTPKWQEFPSDLRLAFKAFGKQISRTKKVIKNEPGREIHERFVPERLSRGKIISALRDHPRGLSLDAIGRHVARDWNEGNHEKWLASILQKLSDESLIEKEKGMYRLKR